ncbi:nucleoside hydrolase [Devosia sp.]|uniref:nucleoside hydrolase n=1 Tax=Devosia sp. TaxID=1871048 RepID=UPI003A8E890C
MTTTTHRIIIDCDPGHDDMAAILLAAANPAIKIEAITAVCGNASVDNTTNNALRIVDTFGLDIPVYRGATQPLLHRYEFPAQFHGPTGLDSAGAELPAATSTVAEGHAVDAIIRLVDANPGEISLVVVGPMTNVALVLALRPDLAPKIKQIVFMGGSSGEGNVTPAAEFNIWADAEAARMVFKAGVPLVMFGLNVTHQTLLRRADVAAVRDAVPGDNMVADILEYYCGTYYRFAGADKPGAPLHDPCCIAWLIDPSLFEISAHAGEVIVDNGGAYGQTLIDLRPQDPAHDQREKNVGLAVAADPERFATLVTQAMIWAAERVSTRTQDVAS